MRAVFDHLAAALADYVRPGPCSLLDLAEPHTPIDTAVRATLVGLGCLGDANAAQPGAMSPSGA